MNIHLLKKEKNIDKAQTSIHNIDDSKKIDIRTDYNNEQKLKESETDQEMKDMVLERNRQMQLLLRSRGRGR